jgi:superfamily II DNA helicase RecQ
VHQKNAITSIVKKKEDIFVSFPTGYGKSVIYQALPFAFDEHTRNTGHIVVVISPLLTLIEDQIQNLRGVGITAASLSHITTNEEIQQVEMGSFAIVYATPEGLLKSERWRHMLTSKVYREKLCAIAVDEAHVIKQW